MIENWRADGREVAVIGLGRSGQAATRLLRARGVAVYASDADQSATLDRVALELSDLGAGVDTGMHDLARIRHSIAAVLSPGVPPEAPPILTARHAGLVVRAEIDVGLEALGGTPYIAVTGTNGKSTVTALVGHLLRVAGRNAEAVGNIGTPLSTIALEQHPPEWLAIEFSSFQLHDCPLINPTVGILTNLSPDHLDRYPTLDAYYDDKRRLFANAHPKSIWVTNAEDPASERMTAGLAGTRLRFSVQQRADGWFDRAKGQLMLGDDALLERRELRLLGDHNVANALAAGLALKAVGASSDRIAEALRTFAALKHRLEPIREVGGVLWVNDSKATNISSTEVALAALDRPFVLLLGGRHKGEPYTRLAPLLKERCRAVVAYGEARPIVMSDLSEVVRVVEAGSFGDVLNTAAELARPGDVVLLSPACSSYDMFQNYEERGATFRAWVEER